MLVLTRRAGESIIIGDNIEISVIEVQGDRAKIGITAPKNISVLRKELVDEVKSINAEAAVISISLDKLGDALNRR
jgi:carbon storage regulator